MFLYRFGFGKLFEKKMSNLNLNYLLSTKVFKFILIILFVVSIVFISTEWFIKEASSVIDIIKTICLVIGIIIIIGFVMLVIYEQIQDKILYKKWSDDDKKSRDK